MIHVQAGVSCTIKRRLMSSVSHKTTVSGSRSIYRSLQLWQQMLFAGSGENPSVSPAATNNTPKMLNEWATSALTIYALIKTWLCLSKVSTYSSTAGELLGNSFVSVEHFSTNKLLNWCGSLENRKAWNENVKHRDAVHKTALLLVSCRKRWTLSFWFITGMIQTRQYILTVKYI